MPSKSQAQHNLMEAVKHDPGFAKKAGIPTSVGADFVAADKKAGKYAEGGEVESGEEGHGLRIRPVNENPSDAQKEAGNYLKAPVYVHGMRITIENPAGTTRHGVGVDGSEWHTPVKHDYGYIRGTVGRDKDHLDVFLGPHAHRPDVPVHVVDQVHPETGDFDEHKVILGAKDAGHASEIYHSNYEPGWRGFGAVTSMPLRDFKDWAFDKAKKMKPASEVARFCRGGPVRKYADGGTVEGDPSQMNFNQLAQLREENRGNMAVQEQLAPYEHGRFTEDLTQQDPLNALALAVATPGYYVAKSPLLIDMSKRLGIVGPEATPGSLKQVSEAFKGIGRGLQHANWRGTGSTLLERVKEAAGYADGGSVPEDYSAKSIAGPAGYHSLGDIRSYIEQTGQSSQDVERYLQNILPELQQRSYQGYADGGSVDFLPEDQDDTTTVRGISQQFADPGREPEYTYPVEGPGGAAFGRYPAIARRSYNDRRTSADMPLQAARGWAAGIAGLPGDLESIARSLVPGVSDESVLPTTERMRELVPFRGSSDVKAAEALGAALSGLGLRRAALKGVSKLRFASGGMVPTGLNTPVGYTNWGSDFNPSMLAASYQQQQPQQVQQPQQSWQAAPSGGPTPAEKQIASQYAAQAINDTTGGNYGGSLMSVAQGKDAGAAARDYGKGEAVNYGMSSMGMGSYAPYVLAAMNAKEGKYGAALGSGLGGYWLGPLGSYLGSNVGGMLLDQLAPDIVHSVGGAASDFVHDVPGLVHGLGSSVADLGHSITSALGFKEGGAVPGPLSRCACGAK